MRRLLLALTIGLAMANPAAFAQTAANETTNSSATDINRVKIGQPAPDFTLEDVDGKNISVRRSENGTPLVYEFNYQDLLNKKNLRQNIDLRPGDVVIVP